MPRRIEGAEPLGPATEPDFGNRLLTRQQLLTPKEAAHFLHVSGSWLAKARMRGDGPPYAQFGRSIHYQESDLIAYVRSRRRLSTSER
jgi:hypothetical protein